MSFQPRSPYPQQSGYGQNSNSSRQASPQQTILQGWGAPARGYSPNPSPRADRQFQSPGSAKHQSPRHLNFSSSSYSSPSLMNSSGFSHPYDRYTSPSDSKFKTPHSPNLFSPPGSRGRGGYSGRKHNQNYHRNFNQTPRQDRNCNPGGSGNIEDYFHPSMLHDPWKFCSSVPVTREPSLTT
ncbi:M-phase-specific PLK1-interacting protein-like [Ylistrum balloti]|uniref:M-phase-specific PLK1-interacting protein-like n=1 Tax=Ylistrum balloti TaxID=509963 RepID=UPI0029059359|nr:M-phase-specific PLK1-interacting protein-like [Ylistrum balloti]